MYAPIDQPKNKQNLRVSESCIKKWIYFSSRDERLHDSQAPLEGGKLDHLMANRLLYLILYAYAGRPRF